MSRACSSLEVRRVGPAGLKALVPAWDELAGAACEPNPFYESWALLPALEAFPDPNAFCAAVFRAGRLDALIPLRSEPRYRGLPARALRSWRHRHMLLCTPLVRTGTERECAAALLRWAREQDGASVLELQYLNAGGAFHAGLLDSVGAQRRTWRVAASYPRALLVRGADARSYMAAAIRKSVQKDLQRRARRLAEAGKVERAKLGPGDDVERWIADFMALEASGWKARAGGAFACREADRRFAAEVLRAAFARGRLMAHGIDVDGKPVARELTFAAGEGGFAFKTAYDERYSRAAPGVLLELDLIRSVHEHPTLQWVDSFTGGPNQKLEALWKGRRTIQRVAVGTDAWGGFLLSLLPLARWAKQKLKGAQPVAAPQWSLRRSGSVTTQCLAPKA